MLHSTCVQFILFTIQYINTFTSYFEYTTVFNIFPHLYLPIYNVLCVTTLMCVTHFIAVVNGLHGYTVVLYQVGIEAVQSRLFLLVSLIKATTI